MKYVKNIIITALLTVFLLVVVHSVMYIAGLDGYDPYYIDYDRPGVDITSEGP